MTSQETREISLKDNIAPAYYKMHALVDDEAYSQFWLSGGRGSLKSSFIAIEIILGIMKDPEANAVCFRKYKVSIRNSIHATLVWATDILGVSHKWKATVAPFELIYLPTGQKIIEAGLDDSDKMKSLKVSKGFFKFLWFEELVEFNGMEEIRSVEQSVLRGGDSFVEFLSYNPPRDPQAWVNKEKEAINDRRYVHHSTYLDAPEKWLGKRFIDDANRMKETDDILYQCEYLGISIGLADSVVFNGKYVVQDFEPQEWWSPLYGADWGFAKDPNVLVKVWIAPHDVYGSNCLYIEYEAYGYNVDNKDIPELYDTIPDSRKHVIRADCSRPETISYISQKDFFIVAADKWPGSVEDGIAFIRSFDKIIIHPRCVKMIEEARLYSYKIDKITKEILPKLVDDYNHCFVGDTMITTINGDVCIKDIQIGDLVLTRGGYKKVIHKYDNGIKQVKNYKLLNGKSLTCTDTHEIITTQGKVKIKDLSKKHRVFYEVDSCKFIETENRKLPYLMAKNIVDIQKAKEELIGCISKEQIQDQAHHTYTLMYINSIMEKLKRITTYTIKMVTHLIMIYLIWSSSTAQYTWLIILKSITMKTRAPLRSTSIELGTKPPNGTKAKKDGRGIKNMRVKQDLVCMIYKIPIAMCAGLNLNLKNTTKDSAQINANQHIGERTSLIILIRNALYAVKSLIQINILSKQPAPKNVQRVYDISVEDCHEYFANGLLVSNCWDSVRYALSKLIKARMSGFTKKQLKESKKPSTITTTAPRENETVW